MSEQRLIDANALKAACMSGGEPSEHMALKLSELARRIDVQPTVDPLHAMGLVYCQECDNCRLNICYCIRFEEYMNENDFCSRGEKRNCGARMDAEGGR